MFKLFKSFLVVLVFVFSSAALAQSSVWKVSKDGQHFFLGGTIHVLSAEDYPLPPEFEQAYRQSQVLVLEADTSVYESPEGQAKMMQALMNDKPLKTVLKSETYQRLADYLASKSLPMGMFGQFKPWAAGLVLSFMEYERLGMKPEFGVDKHFDAAAKRDTKERLFLESGESQLQLIGQVGDQNPDDWMLSTLNELDNIEVFIAAMRKTWRAGDLEALAAHPSVAEIKQYPEIYNAVLSTRNQTWMEKLVTFVDDAQVEFVLVGALHLPDTGGILGLLQADGFTIEQLSATPLAE